MHNRILVTGANGQLGSELKLALKQNIFKVFFTDIDDLDITNIDNIRSFVIKNNIDTIVNCAAYTAVDKAEDELDKADLINHLAVKNLAEVAKEVNAFLIHISTDYVFSGTNYTPYTENDPTNATGVYGKTKLKGEKAIIEKGINYNIIRTSWLYSSFGNNFVKTILRLANERDSLKVIFDQIGTPTYAADLANTIVSILNSNNWESGIYHYSNEGVASWYDFALAISELASAKAKISPCRTEEYPTKAKRPYYSVLDKSKIKQQYGNEIPHWRKSLAKCLNLINTD